MYRPYPTKAGFALRGYSGFTLLELIIVVIIVAVLVAVGIPAFQGAVRKAEIGEIYSIVDAIDKAEQLYYAQYSTFACFLINFRFMFSHPINFC